MATDLGDGSIIGQNVNRMLAQGADAATAWSQNMTRAAADDQAQAMAARRGYDTTTQLITYVGAQALFGSNGTLQNEILAARSAGGQPQSGGGPGQPVVFPVQQQLPNTNQAGGGSPVYIVNPATGTVAKAG